MRVEECAITQTLELYDNYVQLSFLVQSRFKTGAGLSLSKMLGVPLYIRI